MNISNMKTFFEVCKLCVRAVLLSLYESWTLVFVAQPSALVRSLRVYTVAPPQQTHPDEKAGREERVARALSVFLVLFSVHHMNHRRKKYK